MVTGRQKHSNHGEMLKKHKKKSLDSWEGFSVFRFGGLFLGEKAQCCRTILK